MFVKSPHRLLCFFAPVFLGAFLSMSAQTPDPAISSAKLPSTVFHPETLAVKITPNGTRRDVTRTPTATLEVLESHLTVLKPGMMSHPPHRHPNEEMIILEDGTVEASINGKTRRAEKGSVFFFASNDLHNMTNVGTTPATYLVLNFTTATTAEAPTDGAEKAAVQGKMGSRVFNWDQLEFKKTKVGGRRELFDSPTTTLRNFECHTTTLNVGEIAHPSHHHPDEELVVVKEGVMELTVKGKTERGGPGSVFFYASNDEHGMRNAGDTAATYYVIRFITEATPAAPTAK